MCFTVVVGRQATVDGSVLLGHNEENAGPYFVNFRRLHLEQLCSPALMERRSTWPKAIRRPQYGFFWSQIPGREYSDSYLNDAGVAIVSNGCPSREDDLETLIDRQEIQQEGIGGLLRRLVAEQAGSALEAVELIGRLVEQFGYRDSGRTYVVADPQEAWVVAVVRGRCWLAHRVPDDAAVVVPNVFIFDEVGLDAAGAHGPAQPGQPPLHLASKHPLGGTGTLAVSGAEAPIRFSPDLVSYAIQRGWYDPGSGKPFSFREAYQAPERNRPDLRQWWGQWLLQHLEGLQRGAGPAAPAFSAQQPSTQQMHSPDKSEAFRQPPGPLPWYIHPGRKVSVEEVAAVLRNHQGPVSLFHPATQETAIFQLRAGLPRPIGCVYWRTVGRPDWSPLLPWYLGVQQVPEEYCHPAFRGQWESWNPSEPLAQEIFQPDSQLIWWKFHQLRQIGAGLPEPAVHQLRTVWTRMQEHLWQQQAELESELLRLWSADPADCRRRMTSYCIAQSEAACQQVDQFLHQWNQEGSCLSIGGENALLGEAQ